MDTGYNFCFDVSMRRIIKIRDFGGGE